MKARDERRVLNAASRSVQPSRMPISRRKCTGAKLLAEDELPRSPAENDQATPGIRSTSTRKPAARTSRIRSDARSRSSGHIFRKQMSGDEMKAAIAGTISQIGARSIKDMGKVMAALKQGYAGSMDFAESQRTGERLLAG